MPKFKIEHESSHKPSEAYEKIKGFLQDDVEIRRFDPKLECTFNDAQQTGQLKGSQFKADMKISANGEGSKVSLVIDLPLLLTPFKGKVQDTLQKKLTKYLG